MFRFVTQTVCAFSIASLAMLGCSSRAPSSEPPADPPAAPPRSDRPPTPAEAASTFVCPMHPEVRQQGPGRCPSCGMALVAAATGGAGTAGNDSARAAAHEDHAPRHGGQLGMQGDVHVELVVRPDGFHRVFLSDAVRDPIAPERATATSLRFAPSSGGPNVDAPLRADAASGALVATSPLPTRDGDITVRATVGTEQIAMDFSAPSSSGASPSGTTAPHHPSGSHPHPVPHRTR